MIVECNRKDRKNRKEGVKNDPQGSSDIDEEKCNGCGACAAACHEGAIGMVDGKAKLMRDDYCDGLGDCLPACPTGAITFVEREAAAYDEQAVLANKQRRPHRQDKPLLSGCPGCRMRQIDHCRCRSCRRPPRPIAASWRQWPVQIKLVPVNAPYFDGAKLLIAADCTAYAYASLPRATSSSGHITLIGCPKLDERGLQRKAHRDHPQQRRQERDRRPHGGSLLRRIGASGENRPEKQRKIHPVAGRHRDGGRQAERGLNRNTKKRYIMNGIAPLADGSISIVLCAARADAKTGATRRPFPFFAAD